MRIQIIKKALIIAFFLFSLPVYSGKANNQDNPLISCTFSELGYTTKTIRNNQNVEIYINCTSSSPRVYTAKIFLHFTGEDSYYFYRINGGAEGFRGGPGNSYFSGWEERYIDSGFFLEGNNSLQIVMRNYPLIENDPVSYLGKYITIIHDSYIEIYDHDITETSTAKNNNSIMIFGVIIVFFLGAGILGYLIMSRRQKSTIFFGPTSTPYYCGLCEQKHHAGTPRMQCTACGRSFCFDSYSAMTKAGRKFCPMCDGKLEAID